MAGTSDFLQFAAAVGANVELQSTYLADTSTGQGYPAGILPSAKLNKVLRQATATSAMIAKFTADTINGAVVDDGNLANYVSQFELALQDYINSSLNLRTRLTANRTYYVNSSGAIGNDANDGLAAGVGRAWLTIQHAWDTIQSTLDLNGFVVTVQCTGTFTVGLNAGGPIVGAHGPASVVFLGDAGTPTNVNINVTNSNCFVAFNAAAFTVNGFGLTATGSGSTGAAINSGGAVSYLNCNFGTCGSSQLIASGGLLTATGNYTISGDATAHLQVLNLGLADLGSVTINLSTPRNFTTAFISARWNSVVQAGSVLFTGSANAGPRFLVDTAAGVWANGRAQTFYPGASAGTITAPGWYA